MIAVGVVPPQYRLRGEVTMVNRAARRVPHTGSLLAAISLGLAVLGATYGLFALEPSAPSTLLLSTVPVLAVALWMYDDARARGFHLFFDWGFLAFFVWPVMIPWYVRASRGRFQWWLIAGLFLALSAPAVGMAAGSALGAILR